MEYILNNAKFSLSRKQGKQIVYGKVGDKVKLISEHGHVMIVEKENGFRFSILKDHLTPIQNNNEAPENEVDKVSN